MTVDRAMTFGGVLRRYRIAAGLTQEALAERAGLSRRGIADLERGARQSPQRETVRLLVEALGLTGHDRADLEAAVRRGGMPTALRAERRHAPGDLPTPLTPLIGRETECGAALELLRRADVRLLTLTGAGGIGKTRLALAVTRHLAEELDGGAWFIALAPLTDPNLVLPTIAQALGLREAADGTALERLLAFLSNKEFLLLLDNFEHLLPAAPVLTELLRSCPRLKLLVTSRSVLHLTGEHVYAVPPLRYPDVEPRPAASALLDYEAVRLFLERARAVRPDFPMDDEALIAVGAICRRLDGLPLAIELAAARVRVLPPRALITRLDHQLPMLTGGARDLPARQQALRDTIAWSYDLLMPEEQRLFRWLAIFVGGCTLEAAEAVHGVAAAGETGLDTTALLASLVDKSLVQQATLADEPRYQMLEAIREYAVEQLTAQAEIEALRQRHARYFVGFAKRAEPGLVGPDERLWSQRLDGERDNLRAVLHWCVERDAADTGLQIVGALWRWYSRALAGEGSRWAEALLSLPSASGETAARATGLFAAGNLAWYLGDFARAQTWLEESVALWRKIGDKCSLAWALGWLAQTLRFDPAGRGNVIAAESVIIFRETGDALGLATALLFQGIMSTNTGDTGRARMLFEESRGLLRKLGNQRLLAMVLFNEGQAAFLDGDYERARSRCEESLPILRELEDTRTAGLVLGVLGQAALAQGQVEYATAFLLDALSIASNVQNKLGLTACLDALAWVAGSDRQLTRAARLLGASDAVREAGGLPVPVSTRAVHEREIDAVRNDLGKTAFATAWAEGHAMTGQEAIAYAQQAFHPPNSLLHDRAERPALAHGTGGMLSES